MANSVLYTYVYFTIKDFTGLPSLSSFTLPNTPLTFIPDFTSSSTLTATNNISNTLVRWDFGDGNYSNSLTATHVYKWPGKYFVRLSIYDKYGNSYDSSYRPQVTINDFIKDQIMFQEVTKFIYDIPASKIGDPLVVYRRNSWQSYPALSSTGYTLTLYASGAAGDYQNVDNFYEDKWSHLRKLSRFYQQIDLGGGYEYALVEKIKTSSTEIYARVVDRKMQYCGKNDENSVFVGTTGSCSFYYVDDRVKNLTSRESPIFIFATFDGAKFKDAYSQNKDTFEFVDYPPFSFQNLKPAVLPVIKVRHNPAEKLSISTTGIDGEGTLSSTKFNIPEISWQATEIPFVVKLKDFDNFTTKTYPPIYCTQITNTSILPPTTSFSGFKAIESIQISTATVTDDILVTCNYDAFQVPDRFIIVDDGKVLYDTGFRGDDSYNSDLIFLGYDPVQGPGRGSFTFIKPISTSNYFTLSVIAPLNNTRWDAKFSFSPARVLSAFDLKVGIISKDPITGIIAPVTGATFYEDFDSSAPQSIGAFYKGYFTVPDPTLNCTLTASITIKEPPNFPKDSLFGWIALPQYNSLLRFFRQEIYSYCPGVLTLNISADNKFFDAYKNRNVYAIQVAPSGQGPGQDYQTWFADGSRDNLFKFDVNGALLSSFPLSSFPSLSGNKIVKTDLRSVFLSSAAPGSLSLDSNNDLWVALFDSVSCIKIDSRQGYIKSVAYPTYSSICYFLSSDYNLPNLSGFAGENSMTPSSIDTDYDDNVWVTYNHPASNFLIKYDTLGSLLTVIPFSFLISPQEVVVDRNRYVWVTAFNYNDIAGTVSLSAKNDYLYKFTSEGMLVSGYPLTGFQAIGDITVDSQQNAWVVQNKDTLIKVDGATRDLTYYIAGTGNRTNYICSIGGIACDTADFVWVINAFTNQMYFIDTYMSPVSSVLEYDNIPLTYPQASINELSSFEEQTFQAYGDWLGNRWINKYLIPKTTTIVLTGSSNLFNVHPLSGQFSVSKKNEDFNAKDFYKSLIFTDNLEDKKIFFDDFLGTIVGGISAQPYELGKTIYEKIANFTDNINDIDKVNLEQLISFCEELSIQFEQYNYPFPPQLLRLINLLSIKHKNLWGERNKFAQSFYKNSYVTNNNYQLNIGTQYSTLTSSISSGVPLVAYETFSNTYILVNYVTIPNSNYGDVLPLSSYTYDWGWGLIAPRGLSGYKISDYYKFYEYNPFYDNSYFNNIIDWANPLTTLNFNNSSFNTWSKDNGIMQSLISYELTKGLRLFPNSSDIVYNN